MGFDFENDVLLPNGVRCKKALLTRNDAREKGYEYYYAYYDSDYKEIDISEFRRDEETNEVLDEKEIKDWYENHCNIYNFFPYIRFSIT